MVPRVKGVRDSGVLEQCYCLVINGITTARFRGGAFSVSATRMVPGTQNTKHEDNPGDKQLEGLPENWPWQL